MTGNNTCIFCVGYAEQVKILENEVAHLTQALAESKAENKRLSDIAYYDYLTGVPSRRVFDNVMNQIALKRVVVNKKQRPVSLAIIDLDNFGEVNKVYGMLRGDAILKKFARIIKEMSRPSDFFSRLGGEEFGIIFYDLDQEQLRLVVERFRKAVDEKLHLQFALFDEDVEGPEEIKVTASFGVGTWREGESVSEFMERVDAGMQDSKREGKNRVTIV